MRQTLDRYDWDGSGDIDFREFEGLVRVPVWLLPCIPCSPFVCQQAHTLHGNSGLGVGPTDTLHSASGYSMCQDRAQTVSVQCSG